MILAEWLVSQTASTIQLQKYINTEGSKTPLKRNQKRGSSWCDWGYKLLGCACKFSKGASPAYWIRERLWKRTALREAIILERCAACRPTMAAQWRVSPLTGNSFMVAHVVFFVDFGTTHGDGIRRGHIGAH